HAAERERVEDEHHVGGPSEAGQPDGLAMLVLQLQIRGLLADLDRHSLVLSAETHARLRKAHTRERRAWAHRYAQSAISHPPVRTPAGPAPSAAKPARARAQRRALGATRR